jgi:putative transposase
LSVLPKSQKPNASQIKKVNLGYKYKLYPNTEQQKILDHQMFVSNQAYNICFNLWQKERDKNKDLDKKDKKYRSETSYDNVVKRALRKRKIAFKTVVTQQSRMNFHDAVNRAFSKEVVLERQKAINKAKTPKEKAKAFKLGFPKPKSSKETEQSFTWNNQGYTLFNSANERFHILQLMREQLKFRCHRKFPDNFKVCSIHISKNSVGYFVSFNIEFKKEVGLEISSETLDISKSIGIDLNAYHIAVSENMNKLFKDKHNNQMRISLKHLIDNGANNRKKIKYAKAIKTLERKQSRRVLEAKKTKIKLGANHKKTQKKLNKKTKKLANQKKDLYHKISKTLTDTFELIAVEDLKTKNMSRSSKGNEIVHGKKVKQKSGLNRTILNASFYQFAAMLQYKQTMLNDKLFVKVNPAYTSLECSRCGNRDNNNRPKQDRFKCVECGFKINPDIQASQTILKRGLADFGLGTSLCSTGLAP